MYRMPGEVINGERPGLFGLNMIQVFGAILGFFVGSTVSDNFIVIGALVASGLVLASRRKGLYLAEYLYHLGRWVVSYGAALATGQEDEVLTLDPAKLYRGPEMLAAQEGHGPTIILRDPQTGTSVVIKS